MIELGIGADILRGVGWALRLAFLAAIVAALWGGKTWKHKLFYVALVLLVFVGPSLPGIYKQYEYKQRFAEAKALFDERCKTAGERIDRTSGGVEGVLLMKARPKEINLGDQYRLDDPFGADCHGEECIAELLRVSEGQSLNLELSDRFSSGFPFVDFVDPTEKKRYRYRATIEPNATHRLSLQRTLPASPTPTFGVTWDDISTREDRDHWIAGGSLKVLDLKTGEILGERRGYMMDYGQGNKEGGRSPWAFAYDHACPKLPTVSDGRAIRVGHTRKFVFSVLKSPEGK
jgi:hypothetical protein